MQVKVECSGCKEQLTQAGIFSHTALAEVIIEVAPCSCSQPDCSECEDIVLYKEEIKKLKLQLKGAKAELAELAPFA